jgi:hypothetical protein
VTDKSYTPRKRVKETLNSSPLSVHTVDPVNPPTPGRNEEEEASPSSERHTPAPRQSDYTGVDISARTHGSDLDPWSLELFHDSGDAVAFNNFEFDSLVEPSSDSNSVLSIGEFNMENWQPTQYPSPPDSWRQAEMTHLPVPKEARIHSLLSDSYSFSTPSKGQFCTRDRDFEDSSQARNKPEDKEEASLDSCQCVPRAMSLLESLALDGYETASTSMSQVLSYRKNALKICTGFFDCQACSKNSQFLMLMIQIFEKAVQSYNKFARKKGIRPSGEDELTFGEYSASPEETCLVFGSLSAFQLEKWKDLLGRLSDQCKDLGLTRHMVMVLDLDRSVRMQIMEFGANV